MTGGILKNASTSGHMAVQHKTGNTTSNKMVLLLQCVLTCILANLAVGSVCDLNCKQMVNIETIELAAWNMRSYSTGLSYLRYMMQTVDIAAVSEHGLYESQLWKLQEVNIEFDVTAKACKMLDEERANYCIGHSGIALFWRNHLSQYVKQINDIDSDRICAIELVLPNVKPIVVVSVYLPHGTSTIANYEEELAVLEKLVYNAAENGWTIVVLGDFNAHFGPEHGCRGWGRTSPNGRELARFVEQNYLHIVDIDEPGYGPVYTFHSHAGTSYIDHCIVSDNMKDAVGKVWVYDECVRNSSDHMPVGLTIAVPKCGPDSQFVPNRNRLEAPKGIAWSKMSDREIRAKYTDPLEVLMTRVLEKHGVSQDSAYVNVLLSSSEELERYTADIKEAFSSITSELACGKKKRFHLKPYWTDQLSVLSREEKAAWKRWIGAGKPRHLGSEEWQSYKNAKREFRRKQRELEYNYHQKQIEQLCRESEMDQKGFWYIINKARKPRQPKVHPVKSQIGELLTDLGEIAEDWRQYYQELFKGVGKGQGYDDIFYEHVMASVQKMQTKSTSEPNIITESVITVEEVRGIYKKLKTKKSPGKDCISNEHLKHSGPVATRAVTIMLNNMVQLEYIPACFKQGIICPIPKGGGKDTSRKENNRPITLLSCLYKVFEKLMLNRLDKWLQANNVLCELQGAAVSHCSSVDVAALLQETVSHYTEKGETVYVVLMDVAKAFDSVWSEGLWYKLYNLGIKGRFWRLMRACYDGFKCNVLVNDTMSEELKVERGVHQGAPLSMRFYQLYNNDLLTDLSQSPFCVCIAELRTGALGFADDVAVIALYKYFINIVLEKARMHSIKWRYRYNGGKFQGMCFGRDIAENQSLIFGEHRIDLQSAANHMGVPLCISKPVMKEQIKVKCENIKKQVRVMMSLGNKRLPLPPTVGSKIYESVCVPKLLYGVEACVIHRDVMFEIEKCQRYSAKVIQGMPQQTPNPVPMATLGWMSMDSMIDIKKMVFLYHWLSLPTGCIYKKIVILRLITFIYGSSKDGHDSPLYQAFEAIVKHGLQNYVMDVLQNGTTISLKQFRRVAYRAVAEIEKSRWGANMLLYKSLRLFRACFTRIEMCVWWKVSHCRPQLCNATRSVLKLTCRQYIKYGVPGYKFNPSGHCPLCGDFNADTVPHLLFVCGNLSTLRNDLWRNVVDNMPEQMALHVAKLNVENKTRFLLSGFNGSFTVEWIEVYGAAAVFVHRLYKKRCTDTIHV